MYWFLACRSTKHLKVPPLSIESSSVPRIGPNYSPSMIFSTSIVITCKLLRPQTIRYYKSNGKKQIFWMDIFCYSSSRAGTVESRIRQLVMKLEFVESLILAHPFIKGFDQISHCVSEGEVNLVAEGQISEAIAKRNKADIENVATAKTVYSTSFFIGLLIQPKPSASASVDCSVGVDTYNYTVQSWFYWASETRYFIPYYRVHEARQDVGEI